MQAEVRRPLLRGSQPVRALWFDRTLYGEDEARRRLLGAWETGAQAYLLDGGYLLVWKRARRMRCESAPGLPLCDQDGVLASAPLTTPERAGIASGAAVLVFGASLHAHALDAQARIDPSSWLDVSGIPVCSALAMPREAQAGFTAAVPAAALDVRTLLGSAVPPPSASRAEFLRHASRARDGGPSLVTTAAAAAMLAGGVAAGLAGGLAGLVGLLRLALPSSAATGGAARGATRSATPGTPASSPLADWLAARFGKLAAMTRLAHLLGWRQANYLRKMLRQFDEGNLDEALRHAIPLDSKHDATRQAFGRPGRRGSLEIGANASAAAIGLDEGSIDLLRTTYQRSFEMLDRAGRIDEAVFVLAELLNRHQEAVDYLERKERVAQAAQLAETLGLAPALAVRLHAKAGNLARAVLLARLSGCFAEAVGELERRHDAGAAALRLEWAQDLAARGYLAEAAAAVWPLADERMRALDWLRAAEAAGGALGMQGLLHMLALDQDALRSRQAPVGALLTAPGADADLARLRACECLLRLDGHNGATRRVAAELWRVLAVQAAAARPPLPGDTLDKLLKIASDPVLADDAPRRKSGNPPASVPLAARSATLHVSFAETGLHALHDVRALPDGGHLLALGEGGVVLAREGNRAPLRFPVPAAHLVVSHNGRRALALARREKAVRVSRLDLVSGKVEDWFSANLQFWAGEFDGATWSVVADNRLMVLDATAPGQSVLWQVGDLPGKVTAFERQGEHEALLMRIDDAIEQWRYALPARRLLARERAALSETILTVLPDCDDDDPFILEMAEPDRDHALPRLRVWGPQANHVIAAWPHPHFPQASLHDGLLMLCFDAEDGWHCRLTKINGSICAEIVLPDAMEAHATVRGGHLLAWDRRGRVVDVALDTAAVRTLTFG